MVLSSADCLLAVLDVLWRDQTGLSVRALSPVLYLSPDRQSFSLPNYDYKKHARKYSLVRNKYIFDLLIDIFNIFILNQIK